MTDASTYRETIDAALRDIVHEWPFLMADIDRAGIAAIAPSVGSKGTYAPASHVDGDKVSHDGPPLPGGTQRLSLAAGIRALAAYWARAVLDEHACATAALYADDVLSTATWLMEHVEWISMQDDGFEAADQFAALAAQLKAITKERRVKRPAVGPCPHVIDGQPCDGTVRARFGHEDGDRDVICDANREHAWDALRWGQLAKDIDQRAGRQTPPEYMTSDELAEWMTTTFKQDFKGATIRKWVQRNPHVLRTLTTKDGEKKLDRHAVAAFYIDWRGARTLQVAGDVA